ncbi:MAG: CHAP domain-containing protein [Caulobacteraceae bacterium]
MRKRLTAVIGAVALAVAGFTSSAHAASSSLQCAEFARLFSGIQIFGDAATWWRQAMGKYARGFTPETGSVLVFKASGIMAKGHVAVVSHVLTDRIIQVTHANWSVIDGHRGQVEKDVTVVDVSPTGDWSQVKVWYDPSHNLGSTIYPTYGFVYRAAQQAANVASRIAAATGAKTATTGPSSAATSLGEGLPN